MNTFSRDAGGHGGDILAAAEEFGLAPHQFCDFSSNINPLGPPVGLQEDLKEHLDEICRYPTPQARLFRSKLSQFINLPEERIFSGNGANDLIHLLFLWKKPRKVIIPYPTFSEYTRAARLVGGQVIGLPLPLDASLETDTFIELLKDKDTDFLVFCSPNNPTGFFYHGSRFNELIYEAQRCGVTTLIDESFFAFTDGSAVESIAHEMRSNIWVVVSLTKLWALPGLRLGYAVGPPEEVKELENFADPWRVNALAQRAGIYCLETEDYLQDSQALIRKERNFLYQGLQKIRGLTVFPGRANFLLIRVDKKGFSSGFVYRKLAEKGLLIRNAANFKGLTESYFRVAVKNRHENERLLAELQGILI